LENRKGGIFLHVEVFVAIIHKTIDISHTGDFSNRQSMVCARDVLAETQFMRILLLIKRQPEFAISGTGGMS
jgi:peptide subunit release factor 1 (eRF1)